MKFHVCDEYENTNGRNFCLYTERGFQNSDRGDGYPRCIKHGQMFGFEEHADTREQARKNLTEYRIQRGKDFE